MLGTGHPHGQPLCFYMQRSTQSPKIDMSQNHGFEFRSIAIVAG
jgi:hypothetical protein